ncbi:hypothetical protein [Mesorhizobium amorphae]|uniref:Transmembrane protein n=1 Tax=Mesorhizobium amorphae CCNWGS0123 TaxID=1082933 RepID=G6YKP6_9HYPH|nr:hypothetical protein [Mesorhizobium amorphae]ANT48865.1 hypothetical protein A6B35_02395 [Mesorhizobium amorphae CCNWGS0123]EHH03502.1 hypothetical protein MEA186_32907 [Mesorhizobium amorphae CCNWGS0123]GLR43424.1 hypothetical protein GCM10007880_39410 [Mesorhizobium amorphae]
MSKNRLAYFKALGLPAPSTKARTSGTATAETSATAIDHQRQARLAALNRSHEIRQFEIELYWKRATYFWLLQAAVFTALGLIWKDGGKGIPHIIPVALASLGLLTCAAGWLSAQGSKFWQENWERHIDMLEDEFEGKLHKTVWVGRMGVRWSVSNINDRLTLFFGVFWSLVFTVVCFSVVSRWTLRLATSLGEADFTQPAVIGVAVATAGGLFWLYKQKTNLRGSIPDWEAKPQLPKIQSDRPRLLRELHSAPLIVKRGQAE